MLLSGGSTVAVASNSMPDEPLYPLKLATEQVRLTLTLSDIGKADLHATLADRRVAEIASIAGRAEPEKLDIATDQLNTHLKMVASLAKAKAMEEQEKAQAAQEAKKKARERKFARRKAKLLMMAETVLTVIKRHRKGIDISRLKEKTGIDTKIISNIASELRKQGKIKNPRRGVYIKA